MKRKGSSGENHSETKGTKRRKREKKSESDNLKKAEGKTQNNLDHLKTKLDISGPSAFITSIIKPHTLEAFSEEYWEKKPLHLKRDDHEFYGNLFRKEDFFKMIEENTLHFEVDINAFDYVDGKRCEMNGEDDAKIGDIKKLLEKKGATIQFQQPQRFSDALWKMIELLERYFRNLVGATFCTKFNASQIFGPQSENAEAFVLQLDGKDKWVLYKPVDELARESNPEHATEEIGEKAMEVELEPGDLLYFPRGTVYAATSLAKGVSSHLMITTYQNNCWGDFLLEGITTSIETAITNDVELRRGLPIDYLQNLGTGKFLDEYIDNSENAEVNGKENGEVNGKESKKLKVEKSPKKISDDTVEKFKNKLKDLICRAVDHFDPNTVADSKSEDFIASRLPPFEKISDEDIGKEPTASSSIKLLYPEHLRLIVYEEDDDDEFDADAAEETDEEDIIGDEYDMEEEDDDDAEEKKEEKAGKKSKSKGSKEKAEAKPKEKAKDKAKQKKKGKKSDTEDDEMEDDAEEDDDEQEEESLQGPHMRLLFSVHNPREAHMIGGLSEPNAVKLDLHFAKPVKYLMDHCHEFITLKDLPLEDEAEKVELAKTLWTEKLVCVK